MHLLSLLLGHYEKDKPFYLYRAEGTNTLLFRFADVVSIFNLTADRLPSDGSYFVDRESPYDAYVTTTDLAILAIRQNKFLLAELCKLKPMDYAASLDESILSNLPRFVYHKSRKDDTQYTATHLTVVDHSTFKVKSEPKSPPPLSNHISSDPMALNTMLIGAGSQQQQQQIRRPSRVLEEQPLPKKQKKDELPTLLPKSVHTVSSQQPQASSLLAKRLNNNKNARHLTIYAPSYGEQLNTAIRSAPLNSNFRQQTKYNQQHYHPHHSNQLTQPHPLSQATMLSPSSSNATSATHSEFAIPPIVPSQHQQQPHIHHPPHTAHPSSMHHPSHFPPHSPQYPPPPPPPPSTNSGFNFSATRNETIPKTPTHNLLQKQQFMQPFEHLFDTIETTRTLKSTLDDQIRRSSTLIQTLQTSSTTIESLVRNQVKEAQKEVMHRLEDRMEEFVSRLATVERRINHSHSMDTITEEEEDVVEAVDRRKRLTPSLRTSQEPLVNPPTIVKSQHDIGLSEYQQMLDTLRERLDRLERQLES
ncbi:hypothetical protein EDC96DRAFT_528916 [Choanephora cucurbitarum]|nr:hypothetical protein EDC96DRAFT_528916 [Choanephora cucurbitarum]